MPPNATTNEQYLEAEPLEKLIAPQAGPRKYDILWKNVAFLTYIHTAGIYGLYIASSASWKTIAFYFVIVIYTTVAVTAGVHRLWTHKTYKATKALELFLMLGYTISGQYTIFQWVREHRMHHKHSDTDADPHNASRGLFFSHIGWMMVDRHPEIYKRGKLVNMTDLLNNPIIMFQRRHVFLLMATLAVIIPTMIPLWWNETLSNSYHLNILRMVLVLNTTASVNSLAHTFGSKPYDKTIRPSQNLFSSITTLGEGFHNYHHAFPQDYKAGEFGSFLNFTKSFIDFCARIGLAYDLKSVSDDVVRERMLRTGDGAEGGF